MPDSPTELPLEVSCRDVRSKIACGHKFLLLDCREADEFQLVRIREAKLLPMSELIQRVGELEPSRHAEIVVHCHHGGRSLKVTKWLRQQGFSHVQSMAGGIDEWATTIDTSLPRY
jgi:adenylyltransferase/sulfurtransferase